jgi:cytochrome P450
VAVAARADRRSRPQPDPTRSLGGERDLSSLTATTTARIAGGDALATAPSLPTTTLRTRQIVRYLPRLLRDPLFAVKTFPGGPGLLRIRVPTTSIFVIRSPEHARHVLVANQDAYGKGADYKVLGVLLGNGLLTNLDSVSWQRQRALVQPMFAKRHLEPFATHMVAAAADSLERWEDERLERGPIDVAAAMNTLTLDVVGRALFGVDLMGDAQIVGSAMTRVLRAGVAMLRSGLPRIAEMTPGMTVRGGLRLRAVHWRRAMRAIDELDAVVARLMEARRSDPHADQQNLLALLMSARDEQTGAPMSDQQIRDEVMTFLAAGHETTANALAWMWLLLSRHPQAREQLHDEIDSVLGGRQPTAADVERLPWTSAVLQEAMRLYPPVPAVTRVALEGDELGGVRIRRGSLIIVVSYMLHRDRRYWPEPERFDPSRFMPGAPERPRLSFMPFGAGRRICVGAGFALMEGVLLTAMIAQRFQLDLVPGARVTPEPTITLRPRDGLPMTLRRRS